MNKWLQDFAYRINIAVVDIYMLQALLPFDCIDNGKLPGNKSSDCKSCEKFENGIN